MGEIQCQTEKANCHFLKKEANFLGHRLSADGAKPLQNKMKAISIAPVPLNVTEWKNLQPKVSPQ